MSEQNYFTTRQQEFEEQSAKHAKVNVMTRRLQVSGSHKQFVIGLPKSIVKCLDLHEQDLFKIQVTPDNAILMKRVDLT